MSAFSRMPADRYSRDLEPGYAALEVALVAGQSTVTTAYASSPLKLLTPRSRAESVWAYTSSFGGGLLAGDQTRLDVRLRQGARCFLSTQAVTKVYRNLAHLPCAHHSRALIEEDALLVFAPDRVQPFAGSTYKQRQEWHLAPGAGLVLLDWFCSGRVARGERWEFSRFETRNDVFIGGERVFVDSLLLEGSEALLSSAHRVGRFDCFAMLVFIGTPWRELGADLLRNVGSKAISSDGKLLWSASPIREGVLLRVAGVQSQQVGAVLEQHLQPLSLLLGDNPWIRKW
jgi:urease accessory protein